MGGFVVVGSVAVCVAVGASVVVVVVVVVALAHGGGAGVVVVVGSTAFGCDGEQLRGGWIFSGRLHVFKLGSQMVPFGQSNRWTT